MIEKRALEELLEDTDFIRYSTRPSEADKAYWAAYLTAYPDDQHKLEEAKTILLAMFGMLQAEERGKELDRLKLAIQLATSEPTESNLPKKVIAWKKIAWYAAAVLLPVVATYLLFRSDKNTLTQYKLTTAEIKATENSVLTANSTLQTRRTEKRAVLLPDGSKVVLNGHSSLVVAEGFGTDSRIVRLSGEAFFDVVHDDRSAFLVQTHQFTVKVHGTAFNVRAYRDAPVMETSLLRGSVEIMPADSGKSIFLKPNQKLLYTSVMEPTSVLGGVHPQNIPKPEISIEPITISGDGNSIVETVWTRNALEINDERFDQLKEKFERWFRVTIEFEDEAIKQFRFTASFENIPMQQALEAMQLSNTFYYELDGQTLRLRSK
ncbi:FecR family protein [Flavihumibacter sp. UBA7668]|uniref:FecR family protein n=1 Tax=Flavihumibacter sp. UBA7668 TaxID=1946542 RepID=UPI0025BF4566|nr:FecR domain-containing protein [Flavihumibacter sp. UBA7668]